MKNIIILILLFLLLGLTYWYFSQEQVKNLGNITLNTFKNITITNIENYRKWKNLEEFYNSNKEILKKYWINSYNELFKNKDFIFEKLKQDLLSNIKKWEE